MRGWLQLPPVMGNVSPRTMNISGRDQSMQSYKALRNCTYVTQEEMHHERPDKGGLPSVTRGADWRGLQPARHCTSKASQAQISRGNGCPVFKDYCTPCPVKNYDKVQKPDLGTFKPTTSSTAPSTVTNDSA